MTEFHGAGDYTWVGPNVNERLPDSGSSCWEASASNNTRQDSLVGQEGFQGALHSPRRFLNFLEQKYTPPIHLWIPCARTPRNAMPYMVSIFDIGFTMITHEESKYILTN